MNFTTKKKKIKVAFIQSSYEETSSILKDLDLPAQPLTYFSDLEHDY